MFAVRLGLMALIGFGIRLGYALAGDARDVSYDGIYYYFVANVLVDGGGFAHPWTGLPTALHPPAWPVLLGLPSAIGLNTVLTHQVFACVVGTATVALVGIAARVIAGGRVGLVAAAIAAECAARYLLAGGVRVLGALAVRGRWRRSPAAEGPAALPACVVPRCGDDCRRDHLWQCSLPCSGRGADQCAGRGGCRRPSGPRAIARRQGHHRRLGVDVGQLSDRRGAQGSGADSLADVAAGDVAAAKEWVRESCSGTTWNAGRRLRFASRPRTLLFRAVGREAAREPRSASADSLRTMYGPEPHAQSCSRLAGRHCRARPGC